MPLTAHRGGKGAEIAREVSRKEGPEGKNLEDALLV